MSSVSQALTKEILTDAGLEKNVKTLDEALQIFIDELERACP